MKEQAKHRSEQFKALPLRLVKAGYPYTLAMLVLGVVLTLWPAESVWIVYNVSAILLMGLGVIRIFKYFRSTAPEAHEHLIFARGAILVLAGLLLLIYRWALVDLVPVLVATVLFFVACIRTQAALDLKCLRHRLWFLCLIVAGIQIALGLLSVLLVLPLVTTVLTFCGIGLLLEGLADLYAKLVTGKLLKMGMKPDDPKVVFARKGKKAAEAGSDAEAISSGKEEPASEAVPAPMQTAEEGDLFETADASAPNPEQNA